MVKLVNGSQIDLERERPAKAGLQGVRKAAGQTVRQFFRREPERMRAADRPSSGDIGRA